MEANLASLHDRLVKGTYRPSRIRRTYIPKPGGSEKRPVGIPTVQDRIVQTALRHVIEPIFEQTFAENSYGFRPGRGCKDALRQVTKLLDSGHVYIVDADLRQCFDRIPHRRLLDRVKQRVADRRILNLIQSFLKQEILDEGSVLYPENEGTPQGATLSPLLCNIFLNPLDHEMEKADKKMVRYADDLIIACKTREEAEAALEMLREWTQTNGLELHPEKTRIAEMNQPGEYFDFLGYRLKLGKKGKIMRFPSPKSKKRVREKLKGMTRRANGKSMEETISRCNRSLEGWFEYFKHSNKWGLMDIDSWLRMRLRSILRKRRNGKGRGRGNDHHRWPNVYFTKFGLFSLSTARKEAISPQRG
ncbi:MAG: group II intron reverse transcriptase/maturase [Holophagae bacterium]|nr:group II intron reverse transcriptase/maturase [Holophagae bacterium]